MCGAAIDLYVTALNDVERCNSAEGAEGTDTVFSRPSFEGCKSLTTGGAKTR
jgi:hypothetical protein